MMSEKPIEHDKPNPFRALELPTDAANEDVVARGQERIDLAESDEQRLLYRWAMEQLITHPDTRLAYELFEVPEARYQDREDWERFARRHRRCPVDAAALSDTAEPVRLDDFDLAALVRLCLEGWLEPPPLDLTAALQAAPEPDLGPPPLEIGDVLFG